MPCLHAESLGSLTAEGDYQLKRDSVASHRSTQRKEQQRGAVRLAVEDTFVTSAGWIFSPLWSRRAESRRFGFRKGVGSETVEALLDDHSDFARTNFLRRTLR